MKHYRDDGVIVLLLTATWISLTWSQQVIPAVGEVLKTHAIER